jgi:hypothetical protein
MFNKGGDSKKKTCIPMMRLPSNSELSIVTKVLNSALCFLAYSFSPKQ